MTGSCHVNTKFCIISLMVEPKPVVFTGSSLEDLRAFPENARREAGHQLDQVQRGFEPDDWKPMPTIGEGVREIRIRDKTGAFRVVYVAKFERAVYVLHCFQKKSQKTAQQDIELASQRFRELRRKIIKLYEVSP